MAAGHTPEPSPLTDARESDRLRLQLERTQLQIEVSNLVVSKLSLRDLLVTISSLLKRFIDHDVASVVLYDEAKRELRVHALDQPAPGGVLGEGAILPMDGTPPGLAITTRKTVRRDHVDMTEFHAPIMQHAYAAGLRCGCSVPLISHDRILGTINVGCMREAALSDDDQQLLEQIAPQVAIAVDNALNFERAERERKRSQLLLEINNAVTSHLDLEQLVKSISGTLRDVIPHDMAGIALYDPDFNHLREYSNISYKDVNAFKIGDTIPIEGTPAGAVFTTGEPMLIKRPDLAKYPADRYSQLPAEESPKSACLALLVSHGKKLGIAGVASTQEEKFTEADLELFTQIAGQIAIAVDNALNFERARAAEQEIRRRFERERLMLEINNAVVSQLTLKELVRVVSSCLRKVLQPDVTGISLYDPETNQFRAYMFDMPDNFPPIEEGTPMPLEGTVGGMAFISGRAVFMGQPDPTLPLEGFDKALIDGGIRSGGVVPLIARDRKLGFLGVGSFREDYFSEDDQELLGHIANQIAIAVENALAYREIETLKNTLASEKLYLEEEIKSEFNFAEIVGQSAALKKILRQVETVAPTDSAVLLFGETGTGKELIARAIHDLSGRRERTLVKLNCAAIPTGLLESELFGHEKGAFTGAIAQRIGRFELAHKGTLLLDEIGEIPLELQPKLLRVLQEHEFERLGSSRTIKTDARLVAATNCDLPQMVAEKKFRSDLFYRLNVFPVNIPPLRERVDDIPLLAGYFTQKHALRMNKRIKTIDKQTVDTLSTYQWPGNVRELENFIERAVILTSGSELQAPLAELAVSTNGDRVAAGPAAATASAPVSLADAERAHIEEILRQTRGVIGGKGGAAELLGLPISTLRNRMKKLGLK
ncbi:MAG TPA: sigma 54-interacting transcriptional regulator [Pyrinomonadaceae bacterium]|nr:sigma 54-interacting transcriptional regulator [Pyrinomonadaceae bacterium]